MRPLGFPLQTQIRPPYKSATYAGHVDFGITVQIALVLGCALPTDIPVEYGIVYPLRHVTVREALRPARF